MAEFIVTTLTDELDSSSATATLDDFGGAADLSLREALVLAQQSAGADSIVFASDLAGGTVLLSAAIGNLVVNDDVTIKGDAAGAGAGDITLDGGNATRILYVASGSAAIEDLTFQNGRVQGANGGNAPVGPGLGGGGGGGGLGAGGAIFVAAGAGLQLEDVAFLDNAAVGGKGGNNVGSPASAATGGSGAVPGAGAGGVAGSTGINSSTVGMDGGAGGDGGFGAGGGGGGNGGYTLDLSPTASAGNGGAGGDGGFGGGGGGGGGRGLNANGGNAQSLVGLNGQGGFGGGTGTYPFPENFLLNGLPINTTGGGGGGGGGLGGAIFVATGGAISLAGGVTFGGNIAQGGSRGVGGGLPDLSYSFLLPYDGMSAGAAVFLQHADLSISAAAGEVVVIAEGIGDSTDALNRPGTGAGSLLKTGAGVLVLSGANTFGGATTVAEGVLQIDGSLAHSAVTVKTGAGLSGQGATGGLTFEHGASQALVISDALNVTGQVTLDDTALTLSIFGGLPATVGAAYRLIDNDGSDAVVGQFAGFTEGLEFLIGDRLFKFSYQGGDGNDVEVTELNRAPINTLPAEVSALRDTARAFTGADALSVIDLGAGAGAGTFTVHLHVAHGVLGMTAAAGATLLGNGGATASISGALADVNATLATLQYTGDESFTGADILQMFSTAGLGGMDIDAVAITVAPLPGVTLTGNNSANVLTGTTGDDHLIGFGGGDTLMGLEGNDTLEGGSGNNVLIGGDGCDTYVVSSASDAIVEFANEGLDTVQTALASFSIASFGQVENLTGTGANQTLTGNGRDNLITGGSGNSILNGGNGSDTLIGGDGNDRLNGGAGADSMTGGAGNDVYTVDNALDVVNETGGGNDTILSKIDYELAPGLEVENLRVAYGVGALTLTGNELVNRIYGGLGDDTLAGGAQNDILTGGAGNDRLIGGDGLDSLTGGDGADTFVFNRAIATTDTVKDFVSGLDHIEISAAGFGGGLVAGALDADAFLVNSTGKAADAEDRFIYNGTNGYLYFDADGNGGAARELIAKFTGAVPLHESDFIIV